MVSAADTFGLQSVNLGAVGSKTMTWLMWLGLGVIVMLIIGGAVFLIILHLMYNKRIIHFKIVNGRMQKVGEYKGMFQRVGLAGDYWVRTRKLKKILPRPRLEFANNEYWYFEREDGEFINFLIKDMDLVMKEAGVHYIEEDMRLNRIAIQKNLEKRFDKGSFWQKYGHVIMYAFTFIILTVCLIVIFNRISDVSDSLAASHAAIRDAAQILGDIFTRTQSGLIPVNGTG